MRLKNELLYDFFIPCDPVAKARPRFTRQGHVYTPKKTASFETLIALKAKQYVKQMIEHELHLEIEVFLPKPKSVKREAPTVKPDCDNYAKAILDALNGVLYRDDALITKLTIAKKYAVSGFPGVRVVVIV